MAKTISVSTGRVFETDSTSPVPLSEMRLTAETTGRHLLEFRATIRPWTGSRPGFCTIAWLVGDRLKEMPGLIDSEEVEWLDTVHLKAGQTLTILIHSVPLGRGGVQVRNASLKLELLT